MARRVFGKAARRSVNLTVKRKGNGYMDEELTLEEHVLMNFGIVDLYTFVECAGQYRVEVQLRSVEGYEVIAETLYLGCCRESAALAAFEVILERAAVLGFTEIAIGNTNEGDLRKWIRTERNRANTNGYGFDAYIESVTGVLFGRYNLDAMRVDSLYYYAIKHKGPRPPKVFTKIPNAYVEFLYDEEGEELECTS